MIFLAFQENAANPIYCGLLNFCFLKIDGEYLTSWNLKKYYRYPLDIPTVPRKTLSMQDMVGGDNNRTPVIFQGLDNCRIVGEITLF